MMVAALSMPAPAAVIAYGNWGSATKTSTTFDILGRPMQSILPNGERTYFDYFGRGSSIFQGDGSGSEPDKFVEWTLKDGLGNLNVVRTRMKNGSGNWVNDAVVTLTHDAVGNLTSVVNAEGATATISYNKVGQKLTMDDPDLGNWSYAYNRLGNLVRQMALFLL